GRADQIGAPLEVYANPQTQFVAGFIGSPPMNFLAADLAQNPPAKAATLGIRPENLSVTASPARISGKVVYTEALGAETLVHIDLPKGPPATVRQDANAPLPAEGDTVHLDWAVQ